ncbi:MAG: hypothetical protein NTV94_06900, partial [Planctomycetota bacterium]|nr:hypothetical protein [Planctomycetota bacterium]
AGGSICSTHRLRSPVSSIHNDQSPMGQEHVSAVKLTVPIRAAMREHLTVQCHIAQRPGGSPATVGRDAENAAHAVFIGITDATW